MLRSSPILLLRAWIPSAGSAYLIHPMPASVPGSSPATLEPDLSPTERPRTKGTTRSQRALPIAVASAGLFARRVDVRPADVVYVKGILEASEGLAVIFAERGGELVIAAPPDRAAALDELLADLVIEIGARIALDAEGGT
ncbi:MAG TPA: DUF4911 domain-containing protein [Polyangium sp.]|nr:DUF4911 domain-containing protein [Polyangium sp.]